LQKLLLIPMYINLLVVVAKTTHEHTHDTYLRMVQYFEYEEKCGDSAPTIALPRSRE